MKKINLLLMVAAIMVLGQPAFADQDSSQEQSDSKQAQTMQKMHQGMQTMQQQMEQIQATDDADERKRLMQEHMQNMHKTMMMMSNMNQMMMQPGSGHHHGSMECTDETAECKKMNDMADRHGRMDMQMGMMRMMMQQMMDHNAVAEGDSD